MKNLILGLKDGRDCALYANVEVTKADATNEFSKLLFFLLYVFLFLDVEVANFYYKGWFSSEGLDLNKISSFLSLFFEASASCYFLKNDTRRDFELRLEVFEFRLEDLKFGSVFKERSELEEDRIMDLLNE